MRALVTGANGFVGSALVRRLCDRKDSVRCLARRGADLSLLEGLDFELVEGDVTSPPSLERAVEGMDVAFHLAGIRRAPSREEFFRVNAEGTRHLCEAMVAAGNQPRLVLVSSLAAVGPSRDFPDESAPLRPVDWYGESKAEAERVASAFAGQVPVAIARPSRILGPGDKENLVFFKMALKGLRVSVSGGPRPMSTIDVDDVVDGLVLLAERPEAPGEAFFFSRDTTTLEGLQDEVLRVLGRRAFTVRIPQSALSALASAADVFSQRTGRRLPLNRKLAQQLLAPGWTCSTAKARERLGFAPRIGIAESVARSARWYLESGWLGSPAGGS
ncbi:MAG: NAD-dependent epimerase/dehydratase family protein [Myxococcales bacterium]|jgi:dihydroflavonol-4-reductase